MQQAEDELKQASARAHDQAYSLAAQFQERHVRRARRMI